MNNNLTVLHNSQTMSSTELTNLLLDGTGKPKYEKKEINNKIKLMFQDKIEGGNYFPHSES